MTNHQAPPSWGFFDYRHLGLVVRWRVGVYRIFIPVKMKSDGDLTIKGITNMNDNYKILQKMLEAFRNNGYAQVKGYNRFGYLKETDKAVFVSRETGKDTRVPFDKILLGIEALQDEGGHIDQQYVDYCDLPQEHIE